MISSIQVRRRRLLAAAAPPMALAGALIALLLTLQPSPAAGGANGGATACADASEPAAEIGARQLRKTVRCLINEERVARDLSKLARNESLQLAARRHAKVMVETDCLDHRCADELNLQARIARAGYFGGALAWEYAENTGCAPTAEAMVSSWMASRLHRVYLLDRDFRDVGIGATPSPVPSLCQDGYTTFATVIAWRKLTR